MRPGHREEAARYLPTSLGVSHFPDPFSRPSHNTNAGPHRLQKGRELSQFGNRRYVNKPARNIEPDFLDLVTRPIERVIADEAARVVGEHIRNPEGAKPRGDRFIW